MNVTEPRWYIIAYCGHKAKTLTEQAAIRKAKQLVKTYGPGDQRPTIRKPNGDYLEY